MTQLRFVPLAAALAAAAAVVAPQAGAEERLTNFAGREVTTRALIDALRPAPATRTRTRAINLAPMLAAADAEAQPATAKASLDQILFEFDSSRLTPEAQRVLARVGEALASSELAGLVFVVEGHTDAAGSDEYNQRLSVRRAEAVKQHLVANHRIPAARLQAVGKGETELLDRDDPESSANRRVVFASSARPAD
jgi:outer membrane protein OmpA-like peptidoglycan-associated protein